VKLLVLFHDYENHTSIIVRKVSPPWESVEIHGTTRREIAVALLNNYPLKLTISDVFGPGVLVEAPDEAFKVLRILQKLKRPVRRDEEFRRLLENPTLENVRRFISLKKLLEE